jgi:hypothetical protein
MHPNEKLSQVRAASSDTVDTQTLQSYLPTASLPRGVLGDLGLTDVTMEPQPSSCAGNRWFRVSSQKAWR